MRAIATSANSALNTDPFAAFDDATRTKLASIAALEPGWYEGHGVTPSIETLLLVGQIAAALPPITTEGEYRLIGPMADGDVMIEWDSPTISRDCIVSSGLNTSAPAIECTYMDNNAEGTNFRETTVHTVEQALAFFCLAPMTD